MSDGKHKNNHGKRRGDKHFKPQVKPQIKTILYLLPQEVSVAQLAECLPLPKKQVELWIEVNVMEISLLAGMVTFEDITEEVSHALAERSGDVQVIKQVYACDYDVSEKEQVKKYFDILQETFGGQLEYE